MRREGYRGSIRPAVKALKAIARCASLLDPEAVKRYLARAELSEARKEKLVQDFAILPIHEDSIREAALSSRGATAFRAFGG